MDEEVKELLREIRDLQREHLKSWKEEIKRGEELRNEFEREATKSENKTRIIGWLISLIILTLLVYVAFASDLF